MSKGLVAKTSVTINVPVSRVWSALIDPQMIKQFMFGTDVVTEWKVGGPIIWKGIWEGKSYEDKGVILRIEPEVVLEYTHFSAMSGQPDVPENYHTMTYMLAPEGDGTVLTLFQDGNNTEEEKGHSEQMWNSMLTSIKVLTEG